MYRGKKEGGGREPIKSLIVGGKGRSLLKEERERKVFLNFRKERGERAKEIGVKSIKNSEQGKRGGDGGGYT